MGLMFLLTTHLQREQISPHHPLVSFCNLTITLGGLVFILGVAPLRLAGRSGDKAVLTLSSWDMVAHLGTVERFGLLLD